MLIPLHRKHPYLPGYLNSDYIVQIEPINSIDVMVYMQWGKRRKLQEIPIYFDSIEERRQWMDKVIKIVNGGTSC